MTDIFRSAKSVLRRANHHITDLETAIQIVTPDKPYTYAIERDANTGEYLHVLLFSESFSDDISCILFDAVNNLRACLDQMTYAIAIRHLKREVVAYFPFASDLTYWPNRINGMKNHMPNEILTLLERFKPYKGGNNTLWAVDRLANIKKHAILIPVNFGKARITIHTEPHIPGITFAPPVRAQETKFVIYRSTDPPERHPNIEIAYSIVIDHPEPILQSQPPLALLNAMSREVTSVLADTEAECRRIGLVGG